MKDTTEQPKQGKNGYKAFYKDKTIDVYADSSYMAQVQAAELLKVKPNNRYQVTVVLCTVDGEQITHNTSII